MTEPMPSAHRTKELLNKGARPHSYCDVRLLLVGEAEEFGCAFVLDGFGHGSLWKLLDITDYLSDIEHVSRHVLGVLLRHRHLAATFEILLADILDSIRCTAFPPAEH